MATSVSFQPPRSGTDIPILESSATALQPSSHTNISNLDVQSTSNSSLWGLPGLDKDTFYAAALYLYAASGELKSKPLFHHPETPEATQSFLDRLADCFARSKLKDARDHVSATAMVRNEDDKVITIYIAKNQSEKGCQPFATWEELERGDIANENERFAKQLVDWFSKLASEENTLQVNDIDLGPHSDIFKAMCTFSWSRLEHYISTISESDVDLMENVVLVNLPNCRDGWERAKSLINECKLYHDVESRVPNSDRENICLLATYAHSAGQIRNDHGFGILTEKIETSLSRPKLKDLAPAVKWINHLGRHWAAFVYFQRFCRDKKQSGYHFRHHLLRSAEDDWTGDTYRKKINSWTGDLNLTREREVRISVDGRPVLQNRTVEALINDVVETTEKKARVHCEMQLLIHFSRPEVEKCLDYFGCSKKSCWMCWQMISQNFKYSMKNTHRKLFPRWAFPFTFSPSQPGIAEGLRVAYKEMLTLIQDQIIRQIPPSNLEPYPQTSARITPAHQRPRTGDDLDQGLPSRLFSSNIITVPDRFPVVRVPALYLPADDDSLQSLRQVSVDAYERNDSDLAETYLMTDQSFAGKSVLYAFQLLTKPKPARFTTEVVKHGQSIWSSFLFNNSHEQGQLRPPRDGLDPILNIEWRLYYRPCGDGLAPNPRIFSIWRKVFGEEHHFCTWRGDVFIIPSVRSLFDPSDFLPEPVSLDHLICLSSLERHFKGIKMSDRSKYARRKVESDLEYVSSMSERFDEMVNIRREITAKEDHQSTLEHRRVYLDGLIV